MKSALCLHIVSSIAILGICIYASNKSCIDNKFKELGCKITEKFKDLKKSECHCNENSTS